MSTIHTPGSSSVVRQPPTDLRLTNWPLVDDVLVAWTTILGVFAVSVFAGWWSESIVMGLVCFAALQVPIWRLWVPVGFEIGSKGIGQAVLWRRARVPWRMIARYEITKRGILLLPEDAKTPLSRLRGLYIRWRDRREQLTELVRYYVIPRSA